MSSQCPVCQQEISDEMAVCPTCGFRLQDTTQKFTPIPYEWDTESKGAESAADALLKVVRGPQTGIVFKLAGDEISIGRSPHCGVFLNDMTVSRQHAQIIREGKSFIIYDNNSFNGVWINNVNVEAKTLVNGDIIQIGSFCLEFEEA